MFVGEIDDGPAGTALEQTCALMDRYGVVHRPRAGAPLLFSQAFADAFQGRVYLAGYFTPSLGVRADVPEWHVDDDARMVTLWRTLAIDATLERFRNETVLLPPLDLLPNDYPAHLGAAVRRNVEKAGGQVRADYVRLGPDDYLHAEVYCLAAIELMWRRVGLTRVRDLIATPVPLLETGGDIEPFDSRYAEPPVYRPGFE